MKYLFLAVIIFPLFSCAQQPVNFTAVVKVDSSLSSSELYNRAKLFFMNSFNDSKAVLEIQDKESGQLSGKGYFKYEPTSYIGSDGTRGKIEFTVSVFVKDGRYKYEFTSFMHEGNQNPGYGAMPFNLGLITTDQYPYYPNGYSKKMCDRTWDDVKTQINDKILSMISSLKTIMSKPFVAKSDW